MSASSSSSSADAPSTKAERLKALAARKEAEQRAADAKAKYEASMAEINKEMAGMAIASTLERSLDRALDAAADVEVFDRMAEAMKDRHDGDQLMYKDEDQIAEEFWVHGVKEPAEPAGDEVKKWKKHAGAWKAAFLELEMRFIRRAAYANDLKCVYAMQRKQRKQAERQATESSKAAAASEKKAASVVAASASLLSHADKPCKCSTQCDNRACGCKKAGKACSNKCGCSNKDCCNPSSYADDEAGEAAHALALAKYQKGLKAKADAAAAENKKRIADLIALRAEGGLE